MDGVPGLKVLFVAGFGPVVRDPEASRLLYGERIGLRLESSDDDPDYRHAQALEGVRHFALWPLAQAAESCFRTAEWPSDRRAPRAWLEFEVEDLASATESLRQAGVDLLVADREEPWGQSVTRFLDPDGTLVAVTFTPSMR